MSHTYTNKWFTAYLKSKFHHAFCIFICWIWQYYSKVKGSPTDSKTPTVSIFLIGACLDAGKDWVSGEFLINVIDPDILFVTGMHRAFSATLHN